MAAAALAAVVIAAAVAAVLVAPAAAVVAVAHARTFVRARARSRVPGPAIVDYLGTHS